MQVTILTTFFIILSFSILNLLISGSIFLTTKKDLYKKLGLFWFALIINFFIQGMASEASHFVIISCYGFSLITTNLLAYASIHFVNRRYPTKIMVTISAVSFISSLALAFFTNIPFLYKALPVAIGTGVPLLYVSYLFLLKHRKKSTLIMKLEAVVLVLMAVHSINFAIFRMWPEAQLWGWLVSYACYQSLAGILPALSLDFYHRREKARLREEINEKTNHLKLLNSDLSDTVAEKTFLIRALVHDVSNPLTVILVKSQIFPKTPESEDFILSVQQMAKKIQDIITRFRDFEKLSNKASFFEGKKCNINSALNDVASMFSNKLNKKSLKIELTNNLEYGLKDDLEIEIDSSVFINSVLANFISNAIKFSNEGETIKINYFNSKKKLLVSITNFGVGMGEDKISSVYAFDTNETQKGTNGEVGTGFGMPIANRILNKAGGRLLINSNDDLEKGPLFTEMKIEIPYIEYTQSSNYQVAA